MRLEHAALFVEWLLYVAALVCSIFGPSGVLFPLLSAGLAIGSAARMRLTAIAANAETTAGTAVAHGRET